ncbi:MAG: HAD family hydrolase [Chloroflexi bacterium]|nr:MAG: HAD family hydrolase [Chloroflexota bacterium]TME15859.1 MAG: HAD family hydrolase [Chloroflexota bacterium]TME18100.1 MAG: HAD family hydrolase [Chloroflexota bacterium]
MLVMPREEGVRQALAEIGIQLPAGALLRAHHGAMLEYDKKPGPTPDADWAYRYTRGMAQELGVSEILLEQAITGLTPNVTGPGTWVAVIEDSREALPLLRAAGVRLAIVSNADGTAAENLSRLGICQVGPGEGVEVDIVVDSTAVGVAKPDPKIFEFALSATGVRPEEAVHVGDSVLADVGGARAAGIRPLHLDPYELCRFDDHEHIRSLHEVVTLISG